MFHTIGELFLSPIGLSMVSAIAPVKLASLLMGVWLAGSGMANWLAGKLASFTQSLGYLGSICKYWHYRYRLRTCTPSLL